EELPARFVVPALDDIERVFKERCAAAGITHGTIRRFGTPRRLALLVDGLVEKTADAVKDVQGPSVRAAFEADGTTPKTPAIKFAESVKQPVSALKRVTTPKGEYLVATVEEKGRRTFDLLSEVLNACVRGIGFAKSMRWGDVEQSFGRPLQWIVALFGGEVVPVTYSDVKSGRATRGHRFLAPASITLEKPSDYEAVLEKANVVASVEKRRAMMLERIAAAAKKAGGEVLPDEALVEQVVNLVELPCPVVGTFEARHLDLPPEVLIQEMKSHQRYFSLVDAKGALLPKFIAVSNTPVKDEALSIRGYERVLRSRLSDGRFFFDEDRRTSLESKLPKLQRRAWIEGLGNMTEKSDRIQWLATKLAERVGKPELKATVGRAAALCKADLNTGMVGEFPELQGVMGREYALHDKEPKDVAVAIFEHYLPRSAGDGLPSGDAGALIGLADRLDSLAGLFALGKKPTGAKDDFALRRAALTFVRIVVAKGYRFNLELAIQDALFQNAGTLPGSKTLAQMTAGVKQKTNEPISAQLLEFFRGRLESTWRESHRADVVDAVLSAKNGFNDLVGAHKRLDALSAYVAKSDFAALAATFKRVANIVEKQAKDIEKAPVDASKLTDAAEKALHTQVSAVRDAVHAAIKADDFAGALAKVVPLKAPVDAFFDQVMVMHDEPAIKANRVRLLMDIASLFGEVADFSKIQTEAKAA
ncbi:MAG: glycine--tRNA ligase subunit beta, partial [Archangium sp.]|nr:glycine--tRNA ligase subunit beta [Archangium sp.]